MRVLHLSSLLLGLTGFHLAESAECESREEGSVCQDRVQVNATGAISGLMDDVPKEVYEAFVTASSECLHCVGESSVRMLDSGDYGCNSNLCKGCGESSESKWTCWTCCDYCRCMGCPENLGPGDNKVCDDCCYDDTGVIVSVQTAEEESLLAVDFNIDVCMDNIHPLESSATSYIDYTQMLTDFENDLKACYADTESFYDSWSSLCADTGIDLSLMARRDGDGSVPIVFGMTNMDSENAVDTKGSSDDSHHSTTYMIFYSALGFVVLSAFAVVCTAVVVKVLNKRKAAEEAQINAWVDEISSAPPSVEITPSISNPLSLSSERLRSDIA